VQKTMRFEFNISNVEKINPLFSKAIVRVAYHGINRNNSYISKETFNKAIPTLFNIPVVGEYLESKDNFGGHGGKLEISDEGIKWIQTTKPYGVVGENAKVYWEEVTEKDGSVHEYLTVDGVYLWTGRYEELNLLLERNYGQSMEIEIQNGNFAIIDGQEVFKIDDFVFSALCILGVDKGDNPDDHVEPCFESASIMAYSLDKEEFKKQFKQMLDELKFSLNVSQEGGQVMEDVKEQMEVVDEVETVETTDEQQEDVVEQEFENTTSTEVVKTMESTEETNEETDEVDYKAEYEKVKADFEQLQEKFNDLEKELEELRQFKANKLAEERAKAEQELYERFSAELTEEEIEEVKAVASEYTLEQLEEKLFTLVGKKKANFSKQTKKEKQPVKIALEIETKEKTSRYGDLFERFGTK
jgi:hypothetical protein